MSDMESIRKDETVQTPDAAQPQGSAYGAQPQGENAAQGASTKRRSSVLPVVLIIAVVVIIIAANVIIAALPTKEERWQEQYDLGLQYLLDLDYEQAIVAFTAAIEIDENNAQAYIGRAEAYLNGDAASASDDNLTLALADYDTAILLDDTNPDAYEGRGDVHFALGTQENLTAALSDYDAALALDETRAALYLTEAQIYITLEDLSGAAAAYTGAIEGGIETTDAYLGRAGSYYALGMAQLGDEERNAEITDLTDEELAYLNAALSDYETALGMGDTSESTYVNAAQICIITGDYDRAAEILAEGSEAHPDSGEISEMAELVSALIEEQERQALIAEQRQYIEDYYLDMLLSLAQTYYADPSSMGYTDLVGDEFREFAAELEETQFWEQDNGLVLGVYLNGYIYYGEMADGLRSGYGIWFRCGSEDISELAASNFKTVNYIYAGEWGDDYPNGAGRIYSFHRGWNYDMTTETTGLWSYEMTFVDGRGDGTGTFYFSSATGSTAGTSGSTSVSADNGTWIGIEGIDADSANNVCFAIIGDTYFHSSLIVVTAAYKSAESEENEGSAEAGSEEAEPSE